MRTDAREDADWIFARIKCCYDLIVFRVPGANLIAAHNFLKEPIDTKAL